MKMCQMAYSPEIVRYRHGSVIESACYNSTAPEEIVAIASLQSIPTMSTSCRPPVWREKLSQRDLLAMDDVA